MLWTQDALRATVEADKELEALNLRAFELEDLPFLTQIKEAIEDESDLPLFEMVDAAKSAAKPKQPPKSKKNTISALQAKSTISLRPKKLTEVEESLAKLTLNVEQSTRAFQFYEGTQRAAFADALPHLTFACEGLACKAKSSTNWRAIVRGMQVEVDQRVQLRPMFDVGVMSLLCFVWFLLFRSSLFL